MQSPDICNRTQGGTLERQRVNSLPFWVRRSEMAEKGWPGCFQSSKFHIGGRKSHTVMGNADSQDAGKTRQPEIEAPGECSQGTLVVCTVLESNSQGEEGRSTEIGWENPSRLASCHSPSPRGRPASPLSKLHSSSFTVCGTPRNT